MEIDQDSGSHRVEATDKGQGWRGSLVAVHQGRHRIPPLSAKAALTKSTEIVSISMFFFYQHWWWRIILAVFFFNYRKTISQQLKTNTFFIEH